MQYQPSAYLWKTSGEIYTLNQPLTTMGRTPENQIRIDSDKASRTHAEILYEKGAYWLKDLASKNGSWVNGNLVKDTLYKLKDGDVIRIGNFELRFREAESFDTVSDVVLKHPVQKSVLEIDEEKHEVVLRGEVLRPALTATEWKLLEYLYNNQGKVCFRSELIRHVWLPEEPDHRKIDITDYKITLETHFYRLRQKLKLTQNKDVLRIEAIKSYGYKLVVL